MSPISSQRRALTEENSSLSDDDVGFLYQVVIRAEGKPDVEQLPFRALFEAYDEVIGEHDADADPGHTCQRFLFKMADKRVRGKDLFETFENALRQEGIVIELPVDGSTAPTETLENDNYPAGSSPSQTADQDYRPANGTPITPRRRASFNTTYDIGEDATQRSFIERPSSRSSLSRLQTGKPDFSSHEVSPKLNDHAQTPKSQDRTQLIAEFLDVGRRLLGRFDSANPKRAAKEAAPLTNGVLARSAVDHDRSKRMTAISKSRRSSMGSSSNSLDPDDSESLEDSQTEDHDLVEKEEAPPELLYRPQLSDLLRDASTFNMYRQRANCRRILTQWLKRAFQTRQIRQTKENVAVNRDRSTLLRQAFEPWRGIIQQKQHTARTDRFFKHLDERANRARDLYLMTKAFTHWAQLTSEEVARTSAARRHVLSVKYFNAWREITAVNELKAQRFALKRPFKKWHKKASDLKVAETQAITHHSHHQRSDLYWKWFWALCDRRAPEWYDYRLKHRSLLNWLQSFRKNRERDHEITVSNRRYALGSALDIWSQKFRLVDAAQQQAVMSCRRQSLRETFDEWRVQSQLAPAAFRVSSMVNTRIVQNALSKWISKARMANQAEEVNRFRMERNAWTSWNDTLRCLALRARIDERLKMETMYRWILMERFELMRRIREQRIKREVFSRFVTNTRDTCTRLLFHAEIHEDHRTEDLMRAKFIQWKEQVALQREREYVAFEFYAPRLAEESFIAWRLKHQQNVKMEGWARDANFYFSTKRSLASWRQATLDSTKRRRKEAYAKVRRKIKVNMASNALDALTSKTRLIIDMEQQAASIEREKLLRGASELFARWNEKTLHQVQACQDADWHYFRQIAFDQLIQMSETYVIRREEEDQADQVYRRHVLHQAGASLRKLSLRIFSLRNTVETADAMQDRTLRKRSRGFFRHWVENARLKLEARDSPGPTMTPARFSSYGDDGSGPALFDPWYQIPSEAPFKLSDFTTVSQEPVSTSPVVTPNYNTSPSKRAARARALAQMSTTPSTPLQTPFASRLLRAEVSAPRTNSSLRPRTGRRSSVGTSVRFVDETLEELPESPTDGRRSSSRRP